MATPVPDPADGARARAAGTSRKVGIVVVSYNAATAVGATLASMRRARNDTASELILVDNASERGERDRIRHAVEHHVREAKLPWRHVQSEQNLGFAGGNNLGIKTLLADPTITHVCLLNSDVIVPHGWLDRLLASDRDITSPVTNNANSEQWVPVDYDLEPARCFDAERQSLRAGVFEVVDDYATRRHRAFAGNIVDCDATFFCVLFSRAAIERVGWLDERFFPGGYEDDDFCIRARRLGLAIHLDRGVFLHHWGSASFGQLVATDRDANDARNRALLEQKHGMRWQPRHGVPFVSFAQDVAFALNGTGDRRLQARLCRTHGRSLDRLCARHELDLARLRLAVAAIPGPVPARVGEAISTGLLHPELARRWRRLSRAAGAAIRGGAAAALREQLLRDLDDFTGEVHDVADANLTMRAFVDAASPGSKWAPWAVRSWPSRLLSAIRHGVPAYLGLRGIVFFGGYPYPSREHDGYFQRVRAIDRVFEDRWRIYFDTAPPPGPPRWFDRPAANVVVLRATGGWWRRCLARFVLALYVLRCRTVWFHSVLRMGELGFARHMRRRWLRRFLDVHGVVPEEYRLHGDTGNAAACDRLEQLALRNARAAIVVTDAMARHLQAKHGADLHAEIVVLPVFPVIACHREAKPLVDGRPVVVYAGGLHRWQQVPKMIDAIVRTRSTCRHRFYCTDPEAVKSMLPAEALADGSVVVERKAHADLLECYRGCHYGFVLREDHVVNRAACPTKLVEYLAMGIVPIVDSEHIGDFVALGMRFVRLDDLLAGRLPDAATRDNMATANFGVYERLAAQRDAGVARVRQLLGPGLASGSLWARTLWNAAQHFPAHTRRGRWARRIWHLFRPPAPIAAAPPVPPPPLAPCDLLVQVGNFTAGGLENVVHDLNDAFRAAGMRVGLLVLGEAGAGVARARAHGVEVVTARYSDDAYRHWLRTARPRVVMSHYSVDGAALCGEAGIPLVQVIHNAYLWVRGAELAAMQASADHTTLFVAVSEFARAYAVRRLAVPADKCIVIPNGIDLQRFRRPDVARERARLRADLRIDDDTFVFLCVGAVNHQKNQMSLLRAFAACAAACPGARLVVVGPTNEPALLRECETFVDQHGLAGRVTLTGGVTDPSGYYAMADALVHAAFFEGGQLSLLEALAANLPVVTVEVGFASHFAGRKGITTVRPHFDVAEYRGHITDMAASPATEREMAAAMQRVYRAPERPDLPAPLVESFDRRIAYRSYVDIVSQLAGGGAVSRASVSPAWPHLLDVVS